MREPDAIFADPHQAELYDAFDGGRGDLDAYVALVDELGARRVIDVGCGTGCLAVRLAEAGLDVVGVDPAEASVDVARAKPYADRVTWVDGDATALVGRVTDADLAVMTGNVAQVFVTDDDWLATLRAVRSCLRTGGWFVFETRRAEVRDWETWTRPPTPVTLPDGRTAVQSCTVTDVALPLVTFEGWTRIDGQVLHSTSTLRFRSQEEVTAGLDRCGFEVVEVRDAPDRPGKEMVFLARVRESVGD